MLQYARTARRGSRQTPKAAPSAHHAQLDNIAAQVVASVFSALKVFSKTFPVHQLAMKPEMVPLCLKAVLLSCKSHLDRTLSAPRLHMVHANLNLALQVDTAMILHGNLHARNALRAGQALTAPSSALSVRKESLPTRMVLKNA